VRQARQSLERPVPLLVAYAGPRRWVIGSQNRKPLAAVRRALVNEPNHQRNGDAESCAERDEVPQRGKSEDENDGSTDGKEETDESSTDRKLVHVNAWMTVFRHMPPLPQHLPTSLSQAQAASMLFLSLLREMYWYNTPSKPFTSEFAEKGH
jgi:hypothetical protein